MTSLSLHGLVSDIDSSTVMVALCIRVAHSTTHERHSRGLNHLPVQDNNQVRPY